MEAIRRMKQENEVLGVSASHPRMLEETNEQWDDVPCGNKIVGLRRGMRTMKTGYEIQRLSNQLSSGRLRWPKGVFCFRTHEEADAWWTETVRIN